MERTSFAAHKYARGSSFRFSPAHQPATHQYELLLIFHAVATSWSETSETQRVMRRQRKAITLRGWHYACTHEFYEINPTSHRHARIDDVRNSQPLKFTHERIRKDIRYIELSNAHNASVGADQTAKALERSASLST